jgi:hypothetical protein
MFETADATETIFVGEAGTEEFIVPTKVGGDI